jgi:hypothetical protein
LGNQKPMLNLPPLNGLCGKLSPSNRTWPPAPSGSWAAVAPPVARGGAFWREMAYARYSPRTQNIDRGPQQPHVLHGSQQSLQGGVHEPKRWSQIGHGVRSAAIPHESQHDPQELHEPQLPQEPQSPPEAMYEVLPGPTMVGWPMIVG